MNFESQISDIDLWQSSLALGTAGLQQDLILNSYPALPKVTVKLSTRETSCFTSFHENLLELDWLTNRFVNSFTPQFSPLHELAQLSYPGIDWQPNHEDYFISYFPVHHELGHLIYPNIDFKLNSLQAELTHRYVAVEKWFSETMNSTFLSEQAISFLADKLTIIRENVTYFLNALTSLRRALSCYSTLKLDLRLNIRKKTNVFFKMLDDEHILFNR